MKNGRKDGKRGRKVGDSGGWGEGEKGGLKVTAKPTFVSAASVCMRSRGPSVCLLRLLRIA